MPLAIHAEIEPRQSVGIVSDRGSAQMISSNSSSRQPDKRAAQQRAEGEGVPSVRQDAGDRDEILDLLTAEQTFPGLGGDRNAASFQRLFIAP